MSQYNDLTPVEKLGLAIDYIAYGIPLPESLKEFITLEDDHGNNSKKGRRTARKRITPRSPKLGV